MKVEENATWTEMRSAEAARTGTRSPVALLQARELVTIEDGWGNGGDYGTSLRGTAAVRTASEIVHADDGGWRWVSDGETLTPDELVERMGSATASATGTTTPTGGGSAPCRPSTTLKSSWRRELGGRGSAHEDETKNRSTRHEVLGRYVFRSRCGDGARKGRSCHRGRP